MSIGNCNSQTKLCLWQVIILTLAFESMSDIFIITTLLLQHKCLASVFGTGTRNAQILVTTIIISRFTNIATIYLLKLTGPSSSNFQISLCKALITAVGRMTFHQGTKIELLQSCWLWNYNSWTTVEGTCIHICKTKVGYGPLSTPHGLFVDMWLP